MKRDACDILRNLYKLELWRRKNKYSMEDVSLELGHPNELYRTWISGRKLPNNESLKRIKQFLKEKEEK